MNKNNEMKVFTFNESNQLIRVEIVNDVLWFVAKDVAKALNISWSSATLNQIPDAWKGVMKFITPGGEQNLTVISEAGMYKLAFRCQSSAVADKFTNWVASEVLPSIRKTGRYELRPVASCRMSRGEGARADMLDLLWLIGENLERGDQAQIALELGVSRVAVNRTLNGYNRSSRILMALYKKAKENREKNMLYNNPEVMAAQLRYAGRTAVAFEPQDVERVPQLPEVRIMTNKRGGQYGNQNARKHGRKEGKCYGTL